MKVEELADSLDEMWVMLSDIDAKLDAIHKRLDSRDAHNVLMVKHVERLVHDVEFYQRHIGLNKLMGKSNDD